MSMSIDSMASMLNTTNTDATTNYNANALKKSLNGVSSDTSADELMQVCKDFESYFVEEVIKEVKQGKIDFKVDKSGIVHTSIGKVSFSADQIRDNAKEFISTLNKLKPTAAKGTYIKSIYLSSTMSAGIKIDPKSVEEI